MSKTLYNYINLPISKLVNSHEFKATLAKVLCCSGGGGTPISGLTPGALTKALTDSTIGDSVISEVGGLITVSTFTSAGDRIVKVDSTGTLFIDYDNSSNWDSAFDNTIVSAAVTGTSTKTLTLTTQDSSTITTSWTDDTVSLTTTGSSGAATLTSGVLNIPNYTLTGLGGVPSTRTLTINGTTYDLSANRSWTISTGITGSGTGGYLSRWSGTSSLDTSVMYDNGSSVMLGTITSGADKLTIQGSSASSPVVNITNTDNGAAGNPMLRLTAAGISNPTRVLSFLVPARVDWGITLGNEAFPHLYVGGAGNYWFWRANWKDAGIACNTFKIANEYDSNSLGLTSLNTQAITGQTGNLLAGTSVGGTIGDLFAFNVNGSLGIGNATINTSAQLQLNSTSKGLLKNRVTTTQKNAISTPATGLEVYDSTLNNPEYYNGSVWTGDWSKRGNSGTTAGTDFIGTTDNIDLVFKRNNTLSGLIHSTNTAFGYQVLNGTYTGTSNIALGAGSLSTLTSGTNNIAIGTVTGNATSGSKNIIIGHNASIPTGTVSNQLNLGNVLWGTGCSGTSTTPAGSLSVGATAPNASAIFDLVSTTQGFGLPSMTTTQQNAIATPRTGLTIYNSTLGYPTYYNGSAWNAYFSGWSLTGNSGTTAGTNFIGTTDAVDLIFKTAGVTAGRLNNANTNTSYGVLAGNANGSFGYTFVGAYAGYAATNGGDAFGANALRQTTGYYNCAFGQGSLYNLLANNACSAFGYNALYNANGHNNTAFGFQAGNNVTTGQNNQCFGTSTNVQVATNSNQLNLANVLFGINCSGSVSAPAGQLSIGANTPDASALFDMTSTSKGLGLPQMTTTQINAISSPKNGLTVYNTTLSTICFYNGSSWQKVTSTAM